MLGPLTSLAPYLIVFGVGLGVFAGLRLLWSKQPPWLEAALFAFGCLLAFWALEGPESAILQDRLFSVLHAAAMVLAGFAAAFLAKEQKWQAVLWALGLSWLCTCLVLWLLTSGSAAVTWVAVGSTCGLGAALWVGLGRADGQRPITLYTGLMTAGVAVLAGIAGLQALSASLLAVLSLLLAGGAVALYRPAMMPHGVSSVAGFCVAAGAVALSIDRFAAIPALLILALTVFSSNVVQFSKPAESGLEDLSRKGLIMAVHAVPFVLAVLVGYVTLTNP